MSKVVWRSVAGQTCVGCERSPQEAKIGGRSFGEPNANQKDSESIIKLEKVVGFRFLHGYWLLGEELW